MYGDSPAMESSLLRQLHPLKVNPITKEPYLQLPPPHSSIIITPPRLSDAERVLQILNDPRVHMTLQGPPFPYLAEHADFWIGKVKGESDAVLGALQKAAESDGSTAAPIFVGGCPVHNLREVQEDGTDVYLGDVRIDRSFEFEYLRDKVKEEALVKENASRPVGDSEIIWSFGG